jgi:hypothetical protein
MMFSLIPTALQYLSTFLRMLHVLAVSGLPKSGAVLSEGTLEDW